MPWASIALANNRRPSQSLSKLLRLIPHTQKSIWLTASYRFTLCFVSGPLMFRLEGKPNVLLFVVDFMGFFLMLSHMLSLKASQKKERCKLHLQPAHISHYACFRWNSHSCQDALIQGCLPATFPAFCLSPRPFVSVLSFSLCLLPRRFYPSALTHSRFLSCLCLWAPCSTLANTCLLSGPHFP